MVPHLDFLEGVEPTKATRSGGLLYLSFQDEDDVVSALKQFRKRGWPATRTHLSLLVGRVPKGNPFVDQFHLQHVFQQDLLDDPEKGYAFYHKRIADGLRELDTPSTAEEHLGVIIDLIHAAIGAGVVLGHDMQGAWNEAYKTTMEASDTPPNLKPFVGHTLKRFNQED